MELISGLILKQIGLRAFTDNEQLTPEERAELDAWRAKHPDNEATYTRLTTPSQLYKEIMLSRTFDKDAAWAELSKKLDSQ